MNVGLLDRPPPNIGFREEDDGLHLAEKAGVTFEQCVDAALRLADEYGKPVSWEFKGIELNTTLANCLPDFAAIHFARSQKKHMEDLV